MRTIKQLTPIRQNGEAEQKVNDKPALSSDLKVRCSNGINQVSWSEEREDVTSFGQFVYFEQFLSTSELFNRFVESCPLNYSSNNAPDKRSVLGTLLLSVLRGHTRYAHINAVRNDRLNCQLLGIEKMMSEDSVRAAILRLDEDEANAWLEGCFEEVTLGLLENDWVLDIDTTIKVLYGKQEGAVVGYNPKKPGRPSHAYHTYWVGKIRHCLGVDVHPGNESASSYCLEHLIGVLKRLSPQQRPTLVRGDCGFGNEGWMSALELLAQDYLFKIRQSKGVKELIKMLLLRSTWVSNIDGWDYCDGELQLQGWSKKRRVIVYRRLHSRPNKTRPLSLSDGIHECGQLELLQEQPIEYEYAVYITNSSIPSEQIGQLYRDRGDNENCYDELKNQWGWCGYTSKDLRRSSIMAKIIALFYNWWSLFTKLVDEDVAREAITSRPMYLDAVARLTCHQSQRHISITSMHACAKNIKNKLNKASHFLSQLITTTEQLNINQRWYRIIDQIFPQLRGSNLQAPSNLLSG